jgi:hypothetical protein
MNLLLMRFYQVTNQYVFDIVLCLLTLPTRSGSQACQGDRIVQMYQMRRIQRRKFSWRRREPSSRCRFSRSVCTAPLHKNEAFFLKFLPWYSLLTCFCRGIMQKSSSADIAARDYKSKFVLTHTPLPYIFAKCAMQSLSSTCTLAL